MRIPTVTAAAPRTAMVPQATPARTGPARHTHTVRDHRIPMSTAAAPPITTTAGQAIRMPMVERLLERLGMARSTPRRTDRQPTPPRIIRLLLITHIIHPPLITDTIHPPPWVTTEQAVTTAARDRRQAQPQWAW